jgi:hypothetical protein
MSKFAEKIDLYKTAMSAYVKDVNEELFMKVTKGLGPSIYLEDASKVSCSDKAERDRVKDRFLIGKLGLKDSPALDKAVEEVCSEMGSSNKSKYRAVFYYMLVKKLGQEGFYK